VSLNGGAIYTGGSPNWATLTSARVTLPPGRNLFEFVVRNEGAGNPAGLIFFLQADPQTSVPRNFIMRSDNVNALLPSSGRTFIGGTSTTPITVT
jgi:hypothetical protein